jgi:hypothetical protein
MIIVVGKKTSPMEDLDSTLILGLDGPRRNGAHILIHVTPSRPFEDCTSSELDQPEPVV